MNSKIRLTIMVSIFALLASGCVDSVARQKAEREIAKALPDVIGPADKWDVRVEGNARELMDGRIKSVTIAGVNVKADDLPPLAKLEATITGVQADTRSMKITKAENARWTGYLDQEQVEKLLKGKMRYFSEYSVDLDKDSVSVTGIIAYRGLSARGTMKARPTVRKGNEVWITPQRVDVMGLGVDVPGWSVKQLEHIVNPVYVIPTGDLKLSVDRIASENGYIRMEGAFDVQAINPTKPRK